MQIETNWILIKNGHVVDPANNIDEKLDILIKDGIISEVGKDIQTNPFVTVIDAEGKIVAPGLIDLHVHFREPGYEYKEDIESGSAAAAEAELRLLCVCRIRTQLLIIRLLLNM